MRATFSCGPYYLRLRSRTQPPLRTSPLFPLVRWGFLGPPHLRYPHFLIPEAARSRSLRRRSSREQEVCRSANGNSTFSVKCRSLGCPHSRRQCRSTALVLDLSLSPFSTSA